MITKIPEKDLPRIYARGTKPVIGFDGIMGFDDCDRFMSYCRSEGIVIRHWWPYYVDIQVEHMIFRFDVEEPTPAQEIVIKLMFS